MRRSALFQFLSDTLLGSFIAMLLGNAIIIGIILLIHASLS